MTILLFLMMTAGACEKKLDARSLPEDGRAKDGTADYKISTKLMMELTDAVRADQPLPEGFSAEIVARETDLSPVSGIAVTGRFAAPHRLAGETVRIVVQRQSHGCVVRAGRFAREIPPGAFLAIFPWLGPGRGLLEVLVEGIRQNPELDGWHSLDPETTAR